MSLISPSREQDPSKSTSGSDGPELPPVGAPTVGEGVGGPDGATRVSTDDLFAILSNRRRRFTISYLQDATFPIEVGELAMAIAAIENDQSVDALSSQQRKRVYVALYQNHLPKLDAANVVSYHKSRGVVERGPNLDVVVEYLNRVGGLQETIAEPQTAEVSSAPHGRFGVASGLLMVALAVGFVGPVPAPLVLVAVGAAVVLVAGYLLATGDHLETPR